MENINEYLGNLQEVMIRTLTEGKTIEAFTKFENRPITILEITDTEGVAKFQYKDTGEISHIALVSIERIEILDKQ